MTYRTEKDSMGEIQVAADRYWGAQTQRSLENFRIGGERMPLPVIRALGLQKWAAARANIKLGLLPETLGSAIAQAAEEVWKGRWDDHFPLVVWQTGSGTQTNMNANEVIAHRAAEILSAASDTPPKVHPNDHVNLGQSSNDTFPTVMHIAAVMETHERLFPALEACLATLKNQVHEFRSLIKVGRTHLQDATPLTLGQEFSAFETQVALGQERVRTALSGLYALAQGGTAVGTGLNTHPQFPSLFIEELRTLTGLPFVNAPNMFEALASHDACVFFSGALNTLAVSFNKIANDIRLLGSGPRCGLGEILLPENEPGSSIMPGKINPTQAEALTMVAAQVMGNHSTITFAGAQGHLQLNVFKPVIIYNLLQSVRLLSDGIISFTEKCLKGLQPCPSHLQKHLCHSLMLVTALTPHIGYDQAARIAHSAHHEGLSLKEAALKLQLVSATDFDAWVRPESMLAPSR